jgi:excisionase family DNA binding protein
VGLGYSDRVGGEVRYYSVEEAARVLRLTPERVLEMIEVGEIEGIPASGPEGWRIPIHGDASVPPPRDDDPGRPPHRSQRGQRSS